jgi:uncharacterized protein YeaO (DUF488 family)
VKQAQAAATPQEWAAFVRKYRAEMATPENRHTLALLARMSQDANFSVLLRASRTATARCCANCWPRPVPITP